jgi:hypothetical protein
MDEEPYKPTDREMERFSADAIRLYGGNFDKEIIRGVAATVCEAYGDWDEYLRKMEPLLKMATGLKGSTGDAPAPWFVLGPTDLPRAERLVKWATPWTERIRRALFGRPSPPFSDAAKAVAWITREAQQYADHAARQAKKLNRWRRQAGEASRTLGRYGWAGDVAVRGETIPIVEGKRLSPIPANSPTLHRLARETKDLAAATGWGQAQAVAWVLLGTQPMTPGIVLTPHVRSATAPTGEAIAETWATVDVYDTGIGFSHMRRVVTLLRARGWKTKKRVKGRAVTGAETLCDFANVNLPVLPWKAFWQKWNREHPERPFKRIRTLQRALQLAGYTDGRRQAIRRPTPPQTRPGARDRGKHP